MATASNKNQNTTNPEKSEINQTPTIDIEAIIAKAIAEAIQKTSNEYKPVIVELENQVKALSDENQTLKNTQSEKVTTKRIKLMYMGAGRANFAKGKVNLEFKKMFDTREVRYEIFEDMFDMFNEYFTSFELVILNKEIREQVGLDYSFKEYGADKSTFVEMLKLDVNKCIAKIDSLNSQLAVVFLKYFVDEYFAGNQDAQIKYNQITDYYRNKFNMVDLHDQISEMRNS
jgi:hypothetical protein